MSVVVDIRRAAAIWATLLLVVAFGVSSAPAQAAAGGPQWAITVVSAPTNLPLTATEAHNSVEKITINASGGKWTVGFKHNGKSAETESGSEALPFDAPAAEVQAKLEALATIGAGNVSVTGGPGGPGGEHPYLVEFVNGLGDQEISPQIEVGSWFEEELTGAAEATHSSVARGSGAEEDFIVTATNTGGAPTSVGQTITMNAGLTGAIKAIALTGEDSFRTFEIPKFGQFNPERLMSCTLATITCTYSQPVPPGDSLTMLVEVDVTAAEGETVSAHATVQGGGAETPGAATAGAHVSSQPAPFEPATFSSVLSTTQAGAHPNMTTIIQFNTTQEINANGEVLFRPAGDPRSVKVDLPPGLVGNPQAAPKCTMDRVEAETCPSSSAVGVVDGSVLTASGGVARFSALVYGVTPYPDEPAAFAFRALAFPVRLDTSVRSADDYGVTATVPDVIETAPILSTSLMLWGVPDEYNGSKEELFKFGPLSFPYSGPYLPERGSITSAQGFGAPGSEVPTAFMTNPTRCGTAGNVDLTVNSWQQPTVPRSASSALPEITGCEALQIDPQLTLGLTNHASGAPAGYEIGLEAPQDKSPVGLATPAVRDVEVTLPEGTAISPSAANGLVACTDAQFASSSGAKGKCPPESKIGQVTVTTPLLGEQLHGNVYVGRPECEPCTPTDAQDGKLVRLLLEVGSVEGPPGVIVKLAGHTDIDQQTGRLTTIFSEDPQLPFSDLALTVFGGERSPLVNPTSCGPAIAAAHLTAWSAMTDTEGNVTDPGSVADVSAAGVQVEDCSPPTFTPSLTAGMTGSARAGSFSGFSVTVTRADTQQDLGSVTVHTPPGLEGKLSQVTLCPETLANQGACPASSQIGTVSSSVGSGSEPYTVGPGPVFLTGPYGGGSFGLSIVVPAEAGPFRLSGLSGDGGPGNGTVVVRASIKIDPKSAALTVVAGPLPTRLDGIPLHIQKVTVNIDRDGFMFNPTNCDARSIESTIASVAGTTVSEKYPFQAVDCAALPFKPSFAVSTQAKTSRTNGASLHVVVRSSSAQANIASVHVLLPKLLPSRLSTLKQACPAAQFAANPAGCPTGSLVGMASADTPVLPVQLTGPAYFVSHGGAAFPDLDVVLQGYGVTVDLVGNTFIDKAGVTSSTFATVPDVPVTRFDLVLPERRNSALAATGNLCAAGKPAKRAEKVTRRVHGRRMKITISVEKPTPALVMPTTMTGQNGAILKQSTRIAVSGCPRPKRPVRTGVKAHR